MPCGGCRGRVFVSPAPTRPLPMRRHTPKVRPGQIPHLHRGALHAVQRNRCAYCPERFSANLPATVDHVHPRSDHGRLGLGNVLLACEPCNQAKGNRLPYPCERLVLLAVNLELFARGWLMVVPPLLQGSHKPGNAAGAAGDG